MTELVAGLVAALVDGLVMNLWVGLVLGGLTHDRTTYSAGG